QPVPELPLRLWSRHVPSRQSCDGHMIVSRTAVRNRDQPPGGPMSKIKQVLKPADVAPLLGVTTNRIYQLIAEGVLPAIRYGRAVRIPRAAWESWLRQQSTRALSEVGRTARPQVPARRRD